MPSGEQPFLLGINFFFGVYLKSSYPFCSETSHQNPGAAFVCHHHYPLHIYYIPKGLIIPMYVVLKYPLSTPYYTSLLVTIIQMGYHTRGAVKISS